MLAWSVIDQWTTLAGFGAVTYGSSGEKSSTGGFAKGSILRIVDDFGSTIAFWTLIEDSCGSDCGAL
jgi:hypothetical protein